MNRKSLVLSFILVSVIFMLPSISKGSSSQSLGPGKMTYVIATIAGGPQTVDPAQAYDSASSELISNVYDPLIFFSKDSGSSFVPWLADSYSMSSDGLTFTFHIRSNVHWHNVSYGFVTPEDVEYSLERILVRDYTGGPAWTFWWPIFGSFSADLSDPVAQGQLIDNAITRDDVAGTVTIHFQTGKAYLPFLDILSMTWGSIMSKQWCIDNGDWPGTGLEDGSWVTWHNPPTSPFDSPTYKMMGSGPFKFNYLNAAVSWSILRNPSFWGGWDTNRMNLLGFSGVTSRGYVDEIDEYFISEYATRLAGFTASTPLYDNIAVPRDQISSVWQVHGVKQQYPLATQAVDASFIAYNVGTTSPYIGDGGTPGFTFNETGIRPDFFSDVHARRAIAYSFDWPSFIGSAFLGEAQQVGIPLPAEGYEPYYNGSPALKYGVNLTRAAEEWKMAWGGTVESPGPVWTNGLYFQIPYNSGSLPRMAAQEILKANIEAVNPKFHVDVVGVPWNAYGSVWHGGPGGRALGPIYIVGWQFDYADPDDWVTPFIESTGTFSYAQHIDLDPYSSVMDDLIELARRNTTVEGRNYYYQQIWKLYHDEAANIPLENAFGRRVARDWVHGFYYNPSFPGVYGYSLWKENIRASTGTFAGKSADWEDINEDGKVDIKDLAMASKAFGAYFIQPLLPPNPSGPPGTWSSNWNSKADVNLVNPANPATSGRCDMKVDIKDLATIATLYGFIADPWTPGP